MRFPDGVLVAVPFAYLLGVWTSLFVRGTAVDALLVGSVLAATVIAHALFVDPPS